MCDRIQNLGQGWGWMGNILDLLMNVTRGGRGREFEHFTLYISFDTLSYILPYCTKM